MTFAFASLVTHSLFRTDPTDWNKNNTTSYLDLSPLYGYNQFTQDQVRNKSLGRGLLYPDTYSEERLGFVPPAASALLVIFSRNHNVCSLNDSHALESISCYLFIEVYCQYASVDQREWSLV